MSRRLKIPVAEGDMWYKRIKVNVSISGPDRSYGKAKLDQAGVLNQLHSGTFPAKRECNNMHNEQLCCKTGVLDVVKVVASAIVIMCCISIKHLKTFLSQRQIEVLQPCRPS